MEEPTGKAVIRERAKPEFVTIGKHQIISTGKWNDHLMAEWVMLNAIKKYVSIGELARRLGRQTIETKRYTRKRLAGLFRLILKEYGELLVVEYGPPFGRAKAVKLFDPTSELDKQNIRPKLDRMRNRKDITSDQYDQAVAVLHKKLGCT